MGSSNRTCQQKIKNSSLFYLQVKNICRQKNFTNDIYITRGDGIEIWNNCVGKYNNSTCQQDRNRTKKNIKNNK